MIFYFFINWFNYIKVCLNLDVPPPRKNYLTENEVYVGHKPNYEKIKDHFIYEGRLEEVLADYRPPSLPFTALYLERRLVSPRIQAFIDFMVQQSAVCTDYEEQNIAGTN